MRLKFLSKFNSTENFTTDYISWGSLLSFFISFGVTLISLQFTDIFIEYGFTISILSLLTFGISIFKKQNIALIAPYFIIISMTISSFYFSFLLKCTTPLLLVLLYLFIAGLITKIKFITGLFFSDVILIILGLIFKRFQIFPMINVENGLIYAYSISIFLPALCVVYFISIVVNKVLLGTIQTNKKQIALIQKTQKHLITQEKINSIQILAGGLAHDLNNVLMAILGNISLIKMFPDEINENQILLEEAEEACHRAENLTKQLITYSKNSPPTKIKITFSTLIKEVVTFSSHGSKIKPVFSLQEDLNQIYGDKDQIAQVIQNLVLNAIQASSPEDTIEIYACNSELELINSFNLFKGNYVKFSVVDHGSGILPRDQSKIFEPFFTTKKHGSGLGLAISQKIITQHGGILQCESNALKNTTNFFFFLPAVDSSDSTKINEEDKIKPDIFNDPSISKEMVMDDNLPKLVLIMDDQPKVQKICAKMLRKLGYSSQLTKNGSETLSILKDSHNSEHSFAFLILDLTIPGEKGAMEIIDEIRDLDPKIKIILSSGYITEKIVINHQLIGFDALLSKPYHLNSLKQAIQSLKLG